MKIAVSGANGFVGRHVVAELERLGISPVLWVRPTAAIPAQWQRHPVVRIDVLEPPAKVFERLGRPDQLIHLAWGGLPNHKSLHHFEQELPAQYRVLRQLVEDGLRNLVVTGSCLEYGAQSGPLSESLPTRPSDPYGLAKDTLRQQLQYLQQKTPFALTWARVFFLHGEGQSPNSLLPQLRRAVAAGDALFPMSGGEQLRDYLPVDEAAQHLVRLATTGRGHGIVNVCSGEPISVRKLVERWIKQNGWSIQPDLGRFPYPSHEPMAFWGDARKLRDTVGDGSSIPSFADRS